MARTCCGSTTNVTAILTATEGLIWLRRMAGRAVHATFLRDDKRRKTRNMRPAWTAFTALSLCVAASAYADHDAIPYPPPTTTATKLQRLSNLDRAGITVSGLSSGGFIRPPIPSCLLEPCAWSRDHSRRPIWVRREDQEPLLLVLECTLGSGLRRDGSLHTLLRDVVLRAPSCRPGATDSLSFIRQAHAEGSIDDPANLRETPRLAFPRSGRSDRPEIDG